MWLGKLGSMIIQITRMEVKSDRDKSELSSNDSSTFSCKSLKLGICSKSRLKSHSSSSSKMEASSRDKLLTSISKKLRINNIEVISKNQHRMSDPYSNQQVTISCFPETNSLSSVKQISSGNYLEYEELVKKKRSDSKILQNIHGMRGDRMACFDEHCQIKRKWIRNIIFYEKQVKNLYLLKQKRGLLTADVISQIQKDVIRTYSSKTVTKTKINVMQSEVEKYNLVDILKQVLRLYAVYDPEVGYVQGMNLVAAPIAMHMKEVNASFVYFKEVMTYGKLRLFFVQDFENIKHEVRQKFRKLLRFHNIELYEYMEYGGIDYTMFVPYYITLFASLIEIQYMHIVINEFMRDGITFLHKFFLVLLLFLKDRIVEDKQGEGVLTKLGTSYIKSLDIDWRTLLQHTQLINFA